MNILPDAELFQIDFVCVGGGGGGGGRGWEGGIGGDLVSLAYCHFYTCHF